ncbi:MAG: MerR family transcriptional regulator [Ktedonobacteraceae bacterium]
MDHQFYHISEFAHKASVSVRTLRYYDKVGLLSPSTYTESGYRLYTDTDFLRLQQILALKFLGFSLQEIQHCLRAEPMLLQESLAQQKAMMQERRTQLDTVIQAITDTEELLQANKLNWESIVHMIQVIQMTQTNDWREKYFTPEQLQQMEDLSKKHYTEEQRQQIAQWGKNWGEEDQRVVTQQWDVVIAELKRLVSTGQDPTDPEAQALVTQWKALVGEFTHGDAGIQQGLNSMYQDVGNMPTEQRPFPMPYTPEEGEFLLKAMKAHQ